MILLKNNSMRYILFYVLIAFFSGIAAQDVLQWRGINRSGIFKSENILNTWPENGPELLWVSDTLYSGYSSISIDNSGLYLTGIKGSDDFLFCLDHQGKIKWTSKIGKAWEASYPESRCTPTISGDFIYVSTGMGIVACFKKYDGTLVWQKDISADFSGTFGKWGISESLIVDEKQVYFTPGGEKTTMVAINKTTGNIIWASDTLGDNPSYTSPLMIEKNGKKYIVQVTNKHIFAVNAANGDIVWKFDFTQYGQRNNHTNTPIYQNDSLFITSGYGHTAVMLHWPEGKDSVTLAWTNDTLDVHIGGVVLLNGYIYGANWDGNGMGKWCCVEWSTGKTMYVNKWHNKGSIISDGHQLYIYDEKYGNVGLLEPNPNAFKLNGSFQIKHGSGPHWAHPIIHNSILYIRHGNLLMAYNIKKQN